MRKYTISREKLNTACCNYFRTAKQPDSAINDLITACTSMVITAYEKGQNGEPLTDLYPWIVEA